MARTGIPEQFPQRIGVFHQAVHIRKRLVVGPLGNPQDVTIDRVLNQHGDLPQQLIQSLAGSSDGFEFMEQTLGIEFELAGSPRRVQAR